MPRRPPLTGTYATPDVRLNDRVRCLYRKCECVVVGFTDAPVRWPLLAKPGRGGSPSLWVNDDLARAIRTETAAALIHWFGSGVVLVSRWRNALGADNPFRRWAAREIKLLGTAPDGETAKRVGRSEVAVKAKRSELRIPTFHDLRQDNLGAATPPPR